VSSQRDSVADKVTASRRAARATKSGRDHAVGRMPPLGREEMTPAQRAAADEIRRGRRGELSGPFVAAIRSPEFTRRLQSLGEYLRYDHALSPTLREMVILLTARTWTQQYEWHVHEPIAAATGLARGIIDAIAEGRRPVDMSPEEGLLYDTFMELQRTRTLSDHTYARAVRTFGEQGIIDIVGAIGYYGTLAMIMNVAQTPLPEGVVPALRSLP
jgi:4-carboxymuconolactone decarboxylase